MKEDPLDNKKIIKYLEWIFERPPMSADLGVYSGGFNMAMDCMHQELKPLLEKLKEQNNYGDY